MQQSSYMNKVVLCSSNACKCHAELHEAMGDHVEELQDGHTYL